MTGQIAFAGAVSTANPCGFVLFPAHLARQIDSDSDTGLAQLLEREPQP